MFDAVFVYLVEKNVEIEKRVHVHRIGSKRLERLRKSAEKVNTTRFKIRQRVTFFFSV